MLAAEIQPGYLELPGINESFSRLNAADGIILSKKDEMHKKFCKPVYQLTFSSLPSPIPPTKKSSYPIYFIGNCSY